MSDQHHNAEQLGADGAPISLRPEQMRQSRVGKRPVVLPKGVTITVANGKVDVKGPKGTLSRALTPNVKVKIEGTDIHVFPTVTGRDGARFQGLARSIINGMITGAATGYVKTLQLVGTGYRAEVKGKTLNLSLGFSHPVNFPIPEGIKVEIPGDSKGTLIILSGADKETMGQAAAKIRGFRPPEPYGGKGVRFQGEKVREKAGKAAKGGK
jgi:large subunit ribosomal protein L6